MHLKVSFDQREVTSTLELQQVKLQQIASLELVKKIKLAFQVSYYQGLLFFQLKSSIYVLG